MCIPWGLFINHVDRFLDILDPPPTLWTILLNKAYVVIWKFGKTPSPAMSTWFINDPKTLWYEEHKMWVLGNDPRTGIVMTPKRYSNVF